MKIGPVSVERATWRGPRLQLHAIPYDTKFSDGPWKPMTKWVLQVGRVDMLWERPAHRHTFSDGGGDCAPRSWRLPAFWRLRRWLFEHRYGLRRG